MSVAHAKVAAMRDGPRCSVGFQVTPGWHQRPGRVLVAFVLLGSGLDRFC